MEGQKEPPNATAQYCHFVQVTLRESRCGLHIVSAAGVTKVRLRRLPLVVMLHTLVEMRHFSGVAATVSTDAARCLRKGYPIEWTPLRPTHPL